MSYEAIAKELNIPIVDLEQIANILIKSDKILGSATSVQELNELAKLSSELRVLIESNGYDKNIVVQLNTYMRNNNLL